MIALTFALLAQTRMAPANPSYDYTGIPVFTASDPASLLLRNHSATLDVTQKDVHVATITEVKNQTNQPLTVTLTVPRRREGDERSGFPGFSVVARAGEETIDLRPIAEHGARTSTGAHLVHYESDLTATVTIGASATIGIRTDCTLPLGRVGIDRKMRATAYMLSGQQSIGQFVISYRTKAKVVFGLPQPRPVLGWQVGSAGAFVKKTDFIPGDRVTSLTFYPGGFGDLG